MGSYPFSWLIKPSTQKIAQDLVPLAGEDRLGMKLHPVHRPRAVAHSSDLVVFPRAGGHFELARQPVVRHHERVVPRRDERAADAAEDATSVVFDGRRLAVHRSAGADDRASEDRPDRLMPEA